MCTHHVMAFVASSDSNRMRLWSGLWLGHMRNNTRISVHCFTPEDLDFANVHVTQLRLMLN
jgi:hypothetical protein